MTTSGAPSRSRVLRPRPSMIGMRITDKKFALNQSETGIFGRQALSGKDLRRGRFAESSRDSPTGITRVVWTIGRNWVYATDPDPTNDSIRAVSASPKVANSASDDRVTGKDTRNVKTFDGIQ